MSTPKNQNSDVFAERLSGLKQNRRVTQDQIAAAAEVSQATVSDWLNGKVVPKLPEVRRLARFFEISMDYFSEEWAEDVKRAFPPALREGPPGHLVDDLAAEFDGMKEKVNAVDRAIKRIQDECASLAVQKTGLTAAAIASDRLRKEKKL